MCLSDTIEKILSLIHQTVNPHSCFLLIPSSSNKTAKIRFFLGENKNLIQDSIDINDGVIASILKFKEQIRLNNINKTYKGLSYYKIEKNIKSFWGIPIFDMDKIVAILCIDSEEENKFLNYEQVILYFASLIKEHIKTQKELVFANKYKLEFENLYNALSHLTKNIKLEEILSELPNQIKKIINYEQIIILQANNTEAKIVSTSFNHNNELIGKIINFNEEISLMSLSLKNKIPLYYENLSQKILPKIILPHYCYSAILPLHTSEVVLGSIILLSNNKLFETESTKKIVEVLVKNASILIHNSILYKEMENLASHDGLTNLYNHRYFKQQLALKIMEAKRYGTNVSLIISDIDNFKNINDAFGHQIGDKILTSLSKLFKEKIRGIDLIARYGGEEFVIILPNTDYIGSIIIAERIRNELKNKPMIIDGNQFNITMSFGISSYPFDAQTEEDLIKRADRALYFAKTHGKNKSILFRDIVEHKNARVNV